MPQLTAKQQEQEIAELKTLLDRVLVWVVMATAEIEHRHPQAIIDAIDDTVAILHALGRHEAADRVEEGKAKQVKRLAALAAFNEKEGE